MSFSRLNCHWMMTEMRLKSTFPVTIQSPFSHHSVTIQLTEKWDFILWDQVDYDGQKYEYILSIIDHMSFSRYLICRPLQNKSSLSVSRKMKKTFMGVRNTRCNSVWQWHWIWRSLWFKFVSKNKQPPLPPRNAGEVREIR